MLPKVRGPLGVLPPRNLCAHARLLISLLKESQGVGEEIDLGVKVSKNL